MHGQFIWYELTTPDVDAAKTFYPRFTGWGLMPFDSDYTMFTTGGMPVAGIFRLTDEMRQRGVPPNWMPYVESSDVDETARKAASLGGKVMHGPDDIPGTGRFAVVQDPQGAVFGVYKSSTMSGAWDGTPVLGRPSWHELMTTDRVKALEFYRALFGWEMNGEMDMGGGAMYAMYGHGDQMYGGMFDITADMAGMSPFWLVYFHVKDVAKAVATATKAGGTIHRPQIDIPGGSIAILGDPQGAGFALHQVSASVAATTPAATSAKKAATKTVKKVAKAAKKVARGAKKVAKKAAKRARTAAKTVKKKVARPAAKKSSRRKQATTRTCKKGAKTATRRSTRAKPTRRKQSKARRR